MSTPAEEFARLVTSAAYDLGINLKVSQAALAEYSRQRAERLIPALALVSATAYRMALEAERDNVLLFAAESLVGDADAADSRLMGVVEGGLGMLARAIAGAP